MGSLLSQGEIEHLIHCPKLIERVEPKLGMELAGKHRRKDVDLVASGEPHRFRVFLRQSTEIIEDFSVGLTYLSNRADLGRLLLIRFNGSHGERDWSRDGHYSACHIHRTSESLLNAGIFEPKEIERTRRFGLFEDAICQFFHEIAVGNWDEYFREIKERELFGVTNG